MTGNVVFIERARRTGKRLARESAVDAVLRRAHFYALTSPPRHTPSAKGAGTAAVVELRLHPLAQRVVEDTPSLTEATAAATPVSNDGGDDA